MIPIFMKIQKPYFVIIGILSIMFLFCPAELNAQDYLEPPEFFYDVMTSFNQNMYYLLNYFTKEGNYMGDRIVTHYSSFWFELDFLNQADDGGNRSMRIDAFNLFNVHIGKFRLSYFNVLTAGDKYHSYTENGRTVETAYIGRANNFNGGGVSYQDERFHIGAYIGYYDNGEQVEKWDDTVGANHSFYEVDGGLSYTIIPIYYPQNFDFIKSIMGLLTLNTFDKNEGYVETAFREFYIFNRNIETTCYYKYEMFDFAADNNIYGVNTLIPVLDWINLKVDVGYRQFINVKYDFDRFYEDSIFMNLGLRFLFERSYLSANLQVEKDRDVRFDLTWGYSPSQLKGSLKVIPTSIGLASRMLWSPDGVFDWLSGGF